MKRKIAAFLTGFGIGLAVLVVVSVVWLKPEVDKVFACMPMIDCWKSNPDGSLGVGVCPCAYLESIAAAGYDVSGRECTTDPALAADVLGAYLPAMPEGGCP